MNDPQLSFFKDEKKQKRCLEVSLDKLFLALICVVLIIVVSFGLGVAKGRQSVSVPDKPTIVADQTPANTKIEEKTTEDAIQKPELSNSSKKENTNRILQESKTTSFYTIQIACYSKTDIADYHIKRLRQEGYKPFLRKKGQYTVLYVGEYKNKEEAKKVSNRLRKIYNGCIITRLNNNT